MSSQPAHALTLIPGPIEFDDDVLHAMGHPSIAHTAQPFVEVFGDALTRLRTLFISSKDKGAQPFVLSGSGTLGWDITGANFIEIDDEVLVLNTGFFSEEFAKCLETYGANVNLLGAGIGDRPALEEIEKELKADKYRLITITHVDTSTGVLSDVEAIAALVHKVSPETLIVVDGVCSVGSEVIKFDEWGLDYVLSASQKAIGAPAGLSISIASARAIDSIKNRSFHVPGHFINLLNWIPIMQAYESKKPAYFATPAVQNIYALHASLLQYTESEKTVLDRIEVHRQTSDKVKDRVEKLGLQIVAVNRQVAAHGMTAVYLPKGVENAQLLPSLLKKNITFSGGIHKAIATKYFRIGHMGVSVTKPELGHLDKALEALEQTLGEFQKH